MQVYLHLRRTKDGHCELHHRLSAGKTGTTARLRSLSCAIDESDEAHSAATTCQGNNAYDKFGEGLSFSANGSTLAVGA